MSEQDKPEKNLTDRGLPDNSKTPPAVLGPFRMNDGFFGRATELQKLRDAFTRVECGAVEILTVVGQAGSGKTRLVQEFYREIRHRKAFLVTGKCESFKRNIPYAPLITALQEVVRQILTERSERLLVWKDRINQALGANAPLLEQLIPCLAWLVGPHPHAETLTSLETQTRFINVFKDFLAALAAEDHPLVIFLDDLQWVDAVTLKILYRLVTERQSRYLLLIGAYRDREVDCGQPLLLVSDNLKESGFKITRLHLQLFTNDQIGAFLGETLHQTEASVRSLAEICYRKTLGNPFFLSRFCQELNHRRLLYFDVVEGRWVWKPAEIDTIASGENVVDLLVSNIGRLTAELRRILQVASCVGNRFQLGFLVSVLGSPVAQTKRYLAELVRDEYVRKLTPDEAEYGAGLCYYQFVHDRVQQAADSLLEEAERKRIHLQIGRVMLTSSTVPEQDDRLFAIVNHFNYALDLLSESGERLLLAKLNLAAAQKAQTAVAYEEADQYLAKARELLDADCWEVNYDLAYRVYRHQAEITLLGGKFDESEAMLRRLLDRVHSDWDRVAVYDLLIQQYTMENKMAAAVRMGRAALHLLSVDLPEYCTSAEVERELALLRKQVGAGELINMDSLTVNAQPREILAYRIMVQLISPLMFLDQPLLIYMQIRNARMALNGAFCPEAMVFFAGLGVLLGNLYGEYTWGYQLNQFAIQMATKLQTPAWLCVISSSAANYCGWWLKPLRELEPVNTEGYLAGLEAGKVDYIGFVLAHKVCNAFYMGQSLANVFAKIEEYLPVAVKTQNSIAREVLLGFRLRTANLMGLTAARFVWDYDGETEDAYLEQCRTDYALVYHKLFKAETLYLYNRLPEARRLIQQARAAQDTVRGLFARVELIFYEALILAGLGRTDPGAAKRSILEADLEQLHHWADICPANFEHKYALASAEVARLDGDFGKAVDAFDRAVHQARSNGFTQDEALAAELAAGFWRDFGKTDFVRLYLEQADHAYQRWGAVFKRTALAEQYPEFLGSETQAADSQLAGAPPRTPLEVNWLIVQQVTRVLATAGSTSDLLQSLLTAILKNSGFSQGCLAMQEEDTLMVVAEGGLDHQTRQCKITVQTMDVEKARSWSPGMLRYVARTREEVILPVVATSSFMIGDEYLSRRQPQSLVVLPLLYRGSPRGVLYLEERVSPVPFIAERLGLLRMLAALTASVLGNRSLQTGLVDRQSVKNAVTADLSREAPSNQQSIRERFELLFYDNPLPQKQELYSFLGSQEKLPHLLITCFGGFELFALGQTVTQIKWRTLKTRELVAYLVEQQGMPVSKEKIICQLWPDLPDKRAHDLFRTTLYYCRKALQEDDSAIPIRNDQTGLRLDLVDISCDAFLFRRGLEGAKDIASQEAAMQVEELVALYRGAYLDEPQWEWAEPTRLRYQQMAVTAITQLVHYYRHTGNLDKLTRYLERLLEFDPYNSEANELLIRGYAEKGRVNEAKRCYEAYCRLLKEDLGLQPEKTLREILKTQTKNG